MGERAVYLDPAAAVDDRAADLLERMTLAEKVAQLTAVWLTLDPDTGVVAPSQMTFGGEPAWTPEEALANGIGHITRPLGSRPVDPVDGARAVNEVQRRLVEGTRLGVPAICHEECLSGAMFQGATSFPAPLNFASTWDPELIGEVGRAIGREVRAVGAHQGLAPVADVARDARWGRVEETFGEDPYLVGRMTTAYVRGLQADGDLRQGVIATLKHFCGYSFSEGGRNFAPAHVGWRELRDVFLVPFAMAVRDGGAQSVMHSYQEIDGEAPAASRRLLTEVLRDMLGFDGFVVADYGGVAFLTLLHKLAGDSAEAAALALAAGLDVELPNPVDFPRGVPEALGRGLLELADVDRAVTRVLRAKFRLGLFEAPYVDADGVPERLRTPEHLALAARVARRSVTLLGNDGLLPLDAAALGTVAVIGPNADDPLALFGNYSFENHLVSTHFAGRRDLVEATTVLGALTARLGPERIEHVPGCAVTGDDDRGIAAAAEAARRAEVAIVVVGDRAGHFNLGTVGEGTDVSDLSLPGLQPRLVDAVLATGTPTVVALLAGRPHALGAIAGRAAALVQAWFPGAGGADALVDVLLGSAAPEGRSPLTYSASAGAQPRFYNHKHLAGGVPRQADFEPVFPFGHGLTYTTFAYEDLAVTPSTPVDGAVVVGCTVRNVGERAGDEVVQLYLSDRQASVTRPVQELKGFARVPLAPGAAARVTFTVPVDVLAFTGLDGRRRVEPGRIDVAVGASSADIRRRGQVELTGEVRLLPDDAALTSAVEVARIGAR